MHAAVDQMPGMPEPPDRDSPRQALKRWAGVIIEDHNGHMLRLGLDAVRACADYLNGYDAPADALEKKP